MNRRTVLELAALAVAGAACDRSKTSRRSATPPTEHTSGSLMQAPAGPRLQIAMFAYPDMTALDLVGPQLFLATLLEVDVHIVASSMEPIVCDTGISILPTATFETCPERVDVVFVGGGTTGTIAAMKDQRLIDALRARAASARFVTSVCTGAFILGVAGLLRGHRATTHWVVHDLLGEFGAVRSTSVS
jgi:cyclohexyl-isocyanide hydratase